MLSLALVFWCFPPCTRLLTSSLPPPLNPQPACWVKWSRSPLGICAGLSSFLEPGACHCYELQPLGAACSHTFVIGACISVSASISLHQFTFYPNYLPGINILLFNFILRGHQPPPRGHQSLATYYFFRKIVSAGECPEKVRHLHQTTAVLRRGWGGDKETPTGSRLNLTVLKNELFSHHQNHIS